MDFVRRVNKHLSSQKSEFSGYFLMCWVLQCYRWTSHLEHTRTLILDAHTHKNTNTQVQSMAHCKAYRIFQIEDCIVVRRSEVNICRRTVSITSSVHYYHPISLKSLFAPLTLTSPLETRNHADTHRNRVRHTQGEKEVVAVKLSDVFASVHECILR